MSISRKNFMMLRFPMQKIVSQTLYIKVLAYKFRKLTIRKKGPNLPTLNLNIHINCNMFKFRNWRIFIASNHEVFFYGIFLVVDRQYSFKSFKIYSKCRYRWRCFKKCLAYKTIANTNGRFFKLLCIQYIS